MCELVMLTWSWPTDLNTPWSVCQLTHIWTDTSQWLCVAWLHSNSHIFEQTQETGLYDSTQWPIDRWLVSLHLVTNWHMACMTQDKTSSHIICITQMSDWLVTGLYDKSVTNSHMSYMWRDSVVCVTWRMHMCDMKDSCVWRDSFVCMKWLLRMSAIAHS